MEIKMDKRNNHSKVVMIFIIVTVILDVLVDLNVENILNMIYPLSDNLAITQKKSLLEKHIMFSVIIKNIFPIMLVLYSLFLSVDIILFKNIPTRYIKLPIFIKEEIYGNKALSIGLIINVISLILLSSYIYEIFYAKNLF